jgi:hypothetical protein
MRQLKLNRKLTFSPAHLNRFRQIIADNWAETWTIVKAKTQVGAKTNR